MPLTLYAADDDFVFGRYVVRGANRQLLIDGQPARLGARAFDVLIALIGRRNAVVSKNELLDTVWPGLVVEENNLQVQVSSLRKLLGPQTIVTIPGRGYQFSTAATEGASASAPGAMVANVSGAAAASPAAAGQDGWQGNLAAEMPTLYGRDVELATLAALLHDQPKQRLITVTGAGGMGKTRLAQAAARACSSDRAHYPGGVWFVELAPVGDAQLLLPTLARTLGVALDADDGVVDLAIRITDRQMLVVLDNCEHLVEAVAKLVTRLLTTAPLLTLLVTSQESLKVAGERVLRLNTLALPTDDQGGEAAIHDAVTQYGALALFEARAREVVPKFTIHDGNRAAVTDICRQLDGIPLAIEFAAARLPLLGVEGLRVRLGDRFRLLTGGTRLAPKRQQTLRAAMEWSHSLLTANEQSVFRRLGVFSGSFGLDAAQHVGAMGDFDAWEVLDYLGALVDKSLVISEPGTTPRYRLLESARAFALEHLNAAAESDATARRHANALLAQFESMHAALWRIHSDVLLASAAPDIDNLRSALGWVSGEGGTTTALAALVGASDWLWKLADLTTEGARWFAQAVHRLEAEPHGTVPAAIEARLLLGYAAFAPQTAAHREIPALQRAALLFREIDDRRSLYETLATLAQKQVWSRDLVGAEKTIHEADELFDPAWPPTMREGELAARTYLCEVTGRPADGQPFMEALVTLMRESGDQRKLDFAMMQLAENLFIQGKAIEVIAVRREIAQRVAGRRANYEGTNLGNLCAALVFSDQIDEALEVAWQAFGPLQHEGTLRTYADHFALLAFKLGRYAEAARLHGRANANFEASGFAREESELRAARSTWAGLQSKLAPDELNRLLDEGAGMADEAAIRVALGLDRRLWSR